MKKITIIVGVVCLMSSCGIQFGVFQRYQEVNKKCWVANDGTKHTGQVEDYYNEREYDFTSANSCENCDETD